MKTLPRRRVDPMRLAVASGITLIAHCSNCGGPDRCKAKRWRARPVQNTLTDQDRTSPTAETAADPAPAPA